MIFSSLSLISQSQTTLVIVINVLNGLASPSLQDFINDYFKILKYSSFPFAFSAQANLAKVNTNYFEKQIYIQCMHTTQVQMNLHTLPSSGPTSSSSSKITCVVHHHMLGTSLNLPRMIQVLKLTPLNTNTAHCWCTLTETTTQKCKMCVPTLEGT